MIFREAQLYEMEIDSIKREIAKFPKGHLAKKGAYYYEMTGTVQKGITKDQKKVMQLTRKAYLSRRLANLEWNFQLVKTIYKRCKTEDPAEIIKELPAFYRTAPVYYFFHPSVHDQIKNISEENTIHPDGLVYRAGSGVAVRSKSERTIADALDQNGIPYNYEEPLVLGGERRYPDFTIYRPYDGKMVLWEHFGRMDDGGYRQKAIEKLTLYARYGYLPFDNLICSYEQDLRDPAQIHAIIKLFLLR